MSLISQVGHGFLPCPIFLSPGPVSPSLLPRPHGGSGVFNWRRFLRPTGTVKWTAGGPQRVFSLYNLTNTSHGGGGKYTIGRLFSSIPTGDLHFPVSESEGFDFLYNHPVHRRSLKPLRSVVSAEYRNAGVCPRRLWVLCCGS